MFYLKLAVKSVGLAHSCRPPNAATGCRCCVGRIALPRLACLDGHTVGQQITPTVNDTGAAATDFRPPNFHIRDAL